MKILVIEDNSYKSEKIVTTLSEYMKGCEIVIAQSYNSAMKLLFSGEWGLVLVDMSIPTFDKTIHESGGRSLTLGGVDIIRRMNKKNLYIPIVVITQFPSFNSNNSTVTLDQVKSDLESLCLKSYYGTMLFDATKNEWKDQLFQVLNDIINA